MICGNPPYRRTILYAARAVTEAAAFPYCRRDERGILKTAVTRCFAERDERGHQVARAVTEAAASLTAAETVGVTHDHKT